MLLVWWLAGLPLPAMAEGMQKSVMLFQGLEREYYVHLPPGYDGRHAVPVVLVFHGGGGNARQIARHSGFNRLSEKYGFITVYPQAMDKHWNDGRTSEKFLEHDASIHDVAWIEALIGRVREKYAIDNKRVYAAGISNGGMFCQRLAIELGRCFAAIASLACPDSRTACRSKAGESGIDIDDQRHNGPHHPVSGRRNRVAAVSPAEKIRCTCQQGQGYFHG